MSSTVTARERLQILSSLVTGMTIEDVATETERDVDQIRDIAAQHGWPRADAMHRARSVLRQKIELECQPETGTVTPGPGSIDHLLHQAGQHHRASVRAKAIRIRTLVDQLRKAIDTEREAERERARKDAERRAAEEKIAELERQIQKLRAAAGVTKRSPARKPRQANPEARAAQSARMQVIIGRQNDWLTERHVTIAEVRQWAQANGCQFRTSLIPNKVREAWDAANLQVPAEEQAS